MNRFNRLFVVAIMVATVSIACSSPTNPGGPTPTPTPVVTVSMASLSADVRDYITNATFSGVGGGMMITRWKDRPKVDPIRVYSPLDRAASQDALDFLTVRSGLSKVNPGETVLNFVLVDSPSQAEIVISIDRPEDQTACGSGLPIGAPAITSGRVRIAYGLMENCAADPINMRAKIAHEVGHTLGLGHSPAKRDFMSYPGAVWSGSPVIDAAVAFIHGAPVGAKLIGS